VARPRRRAGTALAGPGKTATAPRQHHLVAPGRRPAGEGRSRNQRPLSCTPTAGRNVASGPACGRGATGAVPGERVTPAGGAGRAPGSLSLGASGDRDGLAAKPENTHLGSADPQGSDRVWSRPSRSSSWCSPPRGSARRMRKVVPAARAAVRVRQDEAYGGSDDRVRRLGRRRAAGLRRRRAIRVPWPCCGPLRGAAERG